MYKFIISLAFILFFKPLFAQNKYWVFFHDKDSANLTGSWVSEQTYQQRQHQGLPLHHFTDLPIKSDYLRQLEELGIFPIVKSKWMNGISAELSADQIQQLRLLAFIDKIEPVNQNISVASLPVEKNKYELSLALEQINGTSFLEEDLTGKDVKIGIIDGGFLGANEEPALEHFFGGSKVKATRDFVDVENKEFYDNVASMIDWHGTTVWTMIGGKDNEDMIQYGLASDASYYLARTDHGKKEFRGEEDYWIQAMEWMDSLGVRLINTSLGYSTDFDNPEEDYSIAQIDGKTTKITRAAQIAAREKGLMIVVSAGNDGDNLNWQILSAPADAKDVFTVGATEYDVWQKINYSAIGPDFVDYIKPDIVCYSALGTSFSTPVITGIAAGMMQAAPKLTNFEIMEIIEKAGHLYPFGNNYLGYGVPDLDRILKLMEDPEADLGNAELISTTENSVKLKKNTFDTNYIVIFHKKNEKDVVYQEVKKLNRRRFVVKKPENIARTTISSPNFVLEVEWLQ